MTATHLKNIKLLKARQSIGLSITPRTCLTVTTQYRPNQDNIFRLLIVHTTVYNCLQLSTLCYNVLHCLNSLDPKLPVLRFEGFWES